MQAAPRLGRMARQWLCAAAAWAALLSGPGHADDRADDRPDVVLIMADDLGYADLGCYGGEIDTPHLDALAANGVQFTRFRVAPMCVVSRIAMISGLPMQGGGDAGYTKSTPVFSLLKDAGYTTLMTGKWHAGDPDPRTPALFDRFFGFLGGMTDCFAGGPDWFKSEQPFADFNEDFYATDALTDVAIDFLKEHEGDGRPDLLFLSYNAPHHPCQAPQETVEKYLAVYEDGYDAIRERRLAKQREIGLISCDFVTADHGAEIRRWDELTPQRQRIEAGRMAAYAAMVDEIDQNVGKLMAYLRDSGRLDNTVVIFLSDNGGDYSNGDPRTDAQQIPWQAGTNPTPSNGWAWVKNPPFRSFKHSAYEGALASPLIVHWPAGIDEHHARRIDAPAHITDLYPTLLELAGATYPPQHQGRTLAPLAGASLMPLLRGDEAARQSKPAFAWYQESRAWIQDEWKAVQLYDGPWQLFNLNDDRGETHDLAAEHPERLATFVQRWNAQAAPPLRRPAPPRDADQPGFGWHRLQMITGNQLRSVWPANGATDAPVNTPLTLRFTAPLDFSESAGRKLRLLADADEPTVLWETTFDATHPAQGKTDLVLLNLPELRPGAGYFVTWDPGWAKVGNHPLGPLNNGAYWWRFRTAVTH